VVGVVVGAVAIGGGAVTGGDVAGGEAAGGEVAGGEVAGGEVAGGDAAGDPPPVLSPLAPTPPAGAVDVGGRVGTDDEGGADVVVVAGADPAVALTANHVPPMPWPLIWPARVSPLYR
jgi:hypothetical protein